MTKFVPASFAATIDVGRVAIEIEATTNNIGEPMIEIRESGRFLLLTPDIARLLAETLKIAANSQEKIS